MNLKKTLSAGALALSFSFAGLALNAESAQATPAVGKSAVGTALSCGKSSCGSAKKGKKGKKGKGADKKCGGADKKCGKKSCS
ncbi:MAG: hypothetical protein JRH20_03125 [Deltaproteobacteria bacterium]|nr:hypothetical protein [Deltaproteobacteria bacterium]